MNVVMYFNEENNTQNYRACCNLMKIKGSEKVQEKGAWKLERQKFRDTKMNGNSLVWLGKDFIQENISFQ